MKRQLWQVISDLLGVDRAEAVQLCHEYGQNHKTPIAGASRERVRGLHPHAREARTRPWIRSVRALDLSSERRALARRTRALLSKELEITRGRQRCTGVDAREALAAALLRAGLVVRAEAVLRGERAFLIYGSVAWPDYRRLCAAMEALDAEMYDDVVRLSRGG